MKVQLKVAGMLAVLLLVATVALTHGPKVSAAAQWQDYRNREA